MKKPNFFIIGAPKCGTTSLSRWLGEHPDIFISTPKEPNYFNTDVRMHNRLSLHEYESLFASATERHVAIGEATTGYLRSVNAIPNILRYVPTAKFIVCIRNPVDMCISLHNQQFKDGIETEQSLEHAWNLQAKRANGLCVPAFCVDRTNLLYGPLCSIGTQLQRVLAATAHNNVLIICLDQVAAHPGAVYDRVLNFLGVPSGFRPKFKRHNESLRLPRPIATVLRYAPIIKSHLHLRRTTGVVRLIHKVFATTSDIWVPSDHFVKSILYPYFTHEVDILEGILSKDLSAWRELDR